MCRFKTYRLAEPAGDVPLYRIRACRFDMNQATSSFLNAARWISALLVVVSHVRSLMFVDYPDAVHKTVLIKALYFVSGFGHVAVVIFFVISGYLVGGLTLLNARTKGFSPGGYMLRRFVRVYIVLIPALLVGYLLDRAGMTLFADTGLYTEAGNARFVSLGFDVQSFLDARTLFGNLFMLQDIIVPPWGSNGPLWSLANEWWYYTIFCLGMIAVYQTGWLLRIAGAVLAVGLVVVMPPRISFGLPIWGLGLGLALLDRRWRGWPLPVGLAAFIASLVAVRCLQPWVELHDAGMMLLHWGLDIGVAAGFGIALLCAKRAALRPAPHRWLAGFSYSVYLVHFPAMLFLLALIRHVAHSGIAEQPGIPTLGLAVAVTGVLYVYARGFAAITEDRTDAFRLWLLRLSAGLRHAAVPQRSGIRASE
jgi:peptidoglycan/LPS O-acetylase OafA/YrhL